MAVYTHVDAAEVRSFLQGQNLGGYRDHQGITQGVTDTNYHLFTDRDRYILTLFEKRTDPASLPFVFAFTDHLARAASPGTGMPARAR